MEVSALGDRIVILGNSGSGKTHLARHLARASGLSPIHLDALFWEPGGFNRKRSPERIQQDVAALSESPCWIVEGVFGDLAEGFLPRAHSLIWLDLGWDTCSRSLLERGSESARQQDPEQAERSFQALLAWAGAYWERSGKCSHRGHHVLYDGFSGTRLRFSERSEVDRFMAGWPLKPL